MVGTRIGIWLIALSMLGISGDLRAQDFVADALRSFPAQTIRVEYSTPAKLRTLPNYASLRQRYVGPRLRALEESFAQLGVAEADVDEIMLAWQPGEELMALGGFVAGRLDTRGIADRAAALNIPAAAIGGQSGHCLESGVATECVVVLGDSLAVFGSREWLDATLEVRAGLRPSIISNERFMRLVDETRGGGAIWGVAVGEAVADWFQAWLPAQRNLQFDWTRTFASVEALAYTVEAADSVNLAAKLDCSSAEGATNTRQMLEGLRLFQQLAWQNLNPGRPNPFEAAEVDSSDRRVSLKLTTTYADLESAGAPARP